MKKLVLLLFISISCTAFGQYQNFETWTTTSINSLQGYALSNTEFLGSGIQNTTRSDDAQHGNFSIKMETIVTVTQDTVFGFFLSGDPDEGIPGQEINLPNVDSIIGYYKANILPNDSCVLLCQIKANGNVTGGGLFFFNQSQSEWTRFAFPANALASDSMIFAMATGNPIEDFSGLPGTWLMADNIQLKAANGTMAPILNYSFEDWDDITWEQPEAWVSSNTFATFVGEYPIVKSTDAYSGSFALELNTINNGDSGILEGYATNGQFNDIGALGGAPYSLIPSAIELYYKFIPGTNEDVAFANFIFKNNGAIINEYPTAFQPTTEYELWTQSININEPDTLLMVFFSGNEVGSKLTIDDINFLFTVGESDDLKVDQVVSYPNPASDILNIRYFLKTNSNIKITLTDVNGKLMETLTKGSQASGTYNEAFNTSHYSAGIYFLTVESALSKISKKIILN